MKAAMLSIQPKWCELIASGKKTVEIRKNRPKVDTPFKCYIYCTQPKPGKSHRYDAFGLNGKPVECGGYVVAEFFCDCITRYPWVELIEGEMVYFIPTEEGEASCMEYPDAVKYGAGKDLFFLAHLQSGDLRQAERIK